MEDKIGNFETGKEADFIVLDLQEHPVSGVPDEFARTLSEKLFVR